ncbi:hypothetical protein V494_03035 [Pseudogymnoascus sp. VKM F-4513 (FW-928)]|nr:hypothetical protein V494_03035 [Pseudogymnoascus sp. VKM F-4513 (FW-928)]
MCEDMLMTEMATGPRSYAVIITGSGPAVASDALRTVANPPLPIGWAKKIGWSVSSHDEADPIRRKELLARVIPPKRHFRPPTSASITTLYRQQLFTFSSIFLYIARGAPSDRLTLNLIPLLNNPQYLTMDFTDIFRIVNLAVGGLMVAGGISQFFGDATVQTIIIGVYVIIFGLAVAALEFQIPPQVSRYASFLFSFLGRGIFYIFVGTIVFHDSIVRYIIGAIIGIVGLGYSVLEFIPSIEPPANMREADAGWGAEQV